jgi:hypothetical protein
MHNNNTEVALTGVENIIELLTKNNKEYKNILEMDSESDIFVKVFVTL